VEKIWQKLYVKRVPQAIDFDEITLPEALTRTASRFPDRPALVFQGTIVTYREPGRYGLPARRRTTGHGR
jgi:hypothetical protein